MGRKEKEKERLENKEGSKATKEQEDNTATEKSTEEVAPVRPLQPPRSLQRRRNVHYCLLEFQPSAETIYKCSADCQRWLGHKECLDHWFRSRMVVLFARELQRSKATTRSSSSWKRTRYHYETIMSISTNCSNKQMRLPMFSTTAFFEIVQE